MKNRGPEVNPIRESDFLPSWWLGRCPGRFRASIEGKTRTNWTGLTGFSGEKWSFRGSRGPCSGERTRPRVHRSLPSPGKRRFDVDFVVLMSAPRCSRPGAANSARGACAPQKSRDHANERRRRTFCAQLSPESCKSGESGLVRPAHKTDLVLEFPLANHSAT